MGHNMINTILLSNKTSDLSPENALQSSNPSDVWLCPHRVILQSPPSPPRASQRKDRNPGGQSSIIG